MAGRQIVDDDDLHPAGLERRDAVAADVAGAAADEDRACGSLAGEIAHGRHLSAPVESPGAPWRHSPAAETSRQNVGHDFERRNRDQ